MAIMPQAVGKFCWTITTLDCPPGVDGQDLGISVTTSADGESGDWTSFACSPDPPVDLHRSLDVLPRCDSSERDRGRLFADCDGSIGYG